MLKQKVIETIRKYNLIKKGDKIVVGVSGGPDSICLVNILYTIKEELGIELIICHVNHMIREEADSDENYVQEYCMKRNLIFEAKKIDVEKIAEAKKQGTEETRKRREI